MAPELSIIAPVFNEEESIQEFLKVLRDVLEDTGKSYEVILVNDGSHDSTVSKIEASSWDKVRLINFPINLGHQAALDAGYRASLGALVITMDSDLQHPPEILPLLIKEQFDSGVDVVYATRGERKEDGPLKRTSAKTYYRLMRNLTGIQIEDSAADFRLVTRKVVGAIAALPAGGKVFRLLIPSLNFSSSTVPYEASPRFAGKSKYSLSKMTGLLVNSVVGFSTRPLWLSIQVGILFAFLAVLALGYTFVVFLSGQTVPGWASTSAALLILFSINFFILGVFGLYLGELVRSTKQDVMAGHIIERTVRDG